jgi:hypothetical protein
VAVAGVIAALTATNTKLKDHTFLFQGAGEASIGIANLIAMTMEKRKGIPFEEALKHIWLKDSKGLIVAGRSSGGISEHKAPFAHEHAEMKELGDIVKELKPSETWHRLMKSQSSLLSPTPPTRQNVRQRRHMFTQMAEQFLHRDLHSQHSQDLGRYVSSYS